MNFCRANVRTSVDICCQNTCQNMHMKSTTSNVRLYFKVDVSIFWNCFCQSTNQTRCHVKFAPSHFRIYAIYICMSHEVCQIKCWHICQMKRARSHVRQYVRAAGRVDVKDLPRKFQDINQSFCQIFFWR